MKKFFVRLSLLCLILVSLLTLGCFSVAAEDTSVTSAVTEAVTGEAVTATTETENMTDEAVTNTSETESGSEEAGNEEITTDEVTLETGLWLCPECGGLNEDQFCTSCGEDKPEVTTWHCEECDLLSDGDYCGVCGAKRPDEGIQINFDPSQFVDKLMYMGAGMVGIFLVIGVIILTIVVLSKLTTPKKRDDE